ncbi:peptidoglycan D,D-transpeptidase FtsI family protein [Nocardioides bizhenqiangii]|uniref:Penicillin-binding protein 2 n=1 Tax=Nocardioides bizhenqiangii TaxID=3095076 RepID=A0ABZ0ZKY5_9ACTN|nr:penicillin-binding protein 2 [Nocardioides sp. HM61]WQQ25018.1 penicillin-binding protein 2 [Nocardioides sp. HM61]
MTGPSRPRTAGSPLRASPQVRLKVGFVFIAMVLSVFAARLVQLQGVDPDRYAEMAAAEGSVIVSLPATRGEILDRNGDPLAESIDGRMIIADPTLTSDDAPELATFLARRLDLDYVRVLERLRVEDSRFQYIARQVPTWQAEAVVAEAEEEGFVGLFMQRDPVRIYPNGDLAANLVGFLGTPRRDGSARALAGLEDAFDDYLSGVDGEARYEMGAGTQIPLGDNTVSPAVDGTDLNLTIDNGLQHFTQGVLQQTVEGSHAESGIAIIMDSRTGEILALADYPSYDASEPQEWPKSRYRSSALTDVYEPGSTEKVLTLSSVIDAGLGRPLQQYVVPPVLNRQDQPIHDHWVHGVEHLTLTGILAKSSNIGTVLAADEFAPGELRSYLTAFGFGEETGIGLRGETKGILPEGAEWTDQVDDRIAFGQSLSVNAVQMIAAVNTIANDGVRIDPSLVDGRATLDDGTEVGTEQADERRVISTRAARQTALMMERVLDPVDGAAPLAAVPGYRIAGKTGTAQRVVDGSYDGSHTASFVGFGPTDDPRFTVYVVVHDSRTGGGGTVAGPAFAKLMSHALRRYGVPPTGTRASQLPVEW